MSENQKSQTQNMTTDDLRTLEMCRDIEFLAEEMYLSFAELFKDDPEAHQLWVKTAAEEHNHANQFILAGKLRKGLVTSINLKFHEAASIFKYAKGHYLKFKVSPPTLQQALKTSVLVEKQLHKYHMNCLGNFEDKSQQNLFAMMMAADKEHIGTLEQFYMNRFAADGDLLSVL